MQVDLWVRGQHSLHKFQAIKDYIVRKKEKVKKREKKNLFLNLISIMGSLLRTGKGDSLAEATTPNLP